MSADRLDAIEARLVVAASGVITITPSDVSYLLDLARKQQAALDAVRELTREWEAIGRGRTQFDSALRVCAYKTRSAIKQHMEPPNA